MSFVLAFFLWRVFLPSGLPHGDTGGRPPDVLPSPPPRGWSTGFIATPRTVLGVADFADGGEALAPQHAHLGRAQPQGDVVAFLRDDLRR
jgi:hypothetical protein